MGEGEGFFFRRGSFVLEGVWRLFGFYGIFVKLILGGDNFLVFKCYLERVLGLGILVVFRIF